VIEEERYFSFMVPAMIMMIIGMEIPLIRKSRENYLISNSILDISNYLKGKSNLGIILMIVGLSSGIFSPFLSFDFYYVAYLFSKLLFVGIFYVYFSEIKNKKLYLIIGISALFIQTIVQGLFGELVYTSILGFILLMIGRRTSFSVKMTTMLVGAVLVLILQSIKGEYRRISWYGEGKEDVSNTEAFFSLIADRIQNPEMFFDKEKNFPIVVRFNQGMIQAKVMDYVPQSRPFSGGTTIYNSILASFIPRFLWPDKPMAGGHWNMEYFTGFVVVGYSMNIGPFGESYGNFGVTGGIIFMFFYGLFFNYAIYLLLKIAKNRPTIILWFPIIFLNAIQVETDILMTVNSVIKNCIFIALLYWAADRFLRIQL